MKNFVITISREFGCAGREIGRGIASELGVKFYDRELIDLVADKIGIHADVIKETDEKAGEFFNDFIYGSSTSFYSEKAILAQGEVIREEADKGPCVLFGRCSDFFLREYKNCFNIFLYAPFDYRVNHISKDYQLDEKQAKKMIKKIDKQRHNYYKYVTGKNRGDRDFKDLMVNVGCYGVEGTVELVCKAVRQKFGE